MNIVALLTGFGEGERVPGDSSLGSVPAMPVRGRQRGSLRKEAMDSTDGKRRKDLPAGLDLKKLDLDQIKRIDSLLASLGDYGEIHLIVQHGELRYITKLETYRAWTDDEEHEKG